MNYKLSDQITAFLLAVGSSIPEFTTNLISSFNGESEEAVIGIGVITGSGSFSK